MVWTASSSRRTRNCCGQSGRRSRTAKAVGFTLRSRCCGSKVLATEGALAHGQAPSMAAMAPSAEKWARGACLGGAAEGGDPWDVAEGGGGLSGVSTKNSCNHVNM